MNAPRSLARQFVQVAHSKVSK